MPTLLEVAAVVHRVPGPAGQRAEGIEHTGKLVGQCTGFDRKSLQVDAQHAGENQAQRQE
ncbi:hypothetical protein D3C85_1905230 [compost metagenome]